MSVAVASPPLSTEQALRARALDAVRTTALDVILSADEPLRTADVAREIADRLDLQLTEDELGGLASLARMIMDGDPLFSQSQRQWDLALRMGRAEGDRRKPVERAVEDFIDLIGHPTEVESLAVLIAAVYGRLPDYYERLIRNLGGREQFFRTDDGLLGITRWLVDLSSDEPAEVEMDNFPHPEVVQELRARANRLQADNADAYARALVAAADGPADSRAVLFLTWCAFPDCDPDQVFVALYGADDLHLERGPTWSTVDEWGKVLSEIRSVIREPDMITDVVSASLPVEEEETVSRAPTTVRVADEDLEQIHEYMLQEERTCRVSELCQHVLEAFPGSRTYAAVAASLSNRMREDPRFVWVGAERFRIAGSIPLEILQIPDGMSFDDREYLGEEGEAVDRVVSVHDWKYALTDQITHSLVQDYGDDGTAPAPVPPKRIEVGVPLHHYVAGTFYLRNSDRGFFPQTPDQVHVSFLLSGGGRFDVWVNNRLGLVFGLKEWYDANLPWVGGHFVLEPTENPDEYRLSHADVEPLMDVPMDQLPALLALRAEATTDAMPLSALVQRILQGKPDGVHFVKLFTCVNIVRRIRRAQLASILSSQRYFAQNPQMPGIWTFDEKRAQKTKRRAGPRRPAREAYADDDEDIEYE